MPNKTKVVLQNGDQIILDAPVETVHKALSEDKYKSGESFAPFTSAQGKRVFIAGDKVAYLEAE